MSTLSGGPNIVTDGLVFNVDAANVKSYPGSGTTWRDLSRGGNNGTLVNGPTYNTANGGSIVFDGVNDYGDFGNPTSLNFGTGNFTVSVWFRRFSSAATNRRILSKGSESDISSEAGFAIFGSDTSAVFAVNPSGTRVIITAATYTVNEWVNIVGVLERNISIRAYQNSILTSTETAPIGSISGTDNFYIGRSSTSTSVNWGGNISNIQIYNRALSDQEVLQNYNSTKTRFGL
jgi:hypothetical protein